MKEADVLSASTTYFETECNFDTKASSNVTRKDDRKNMFTLFGWGFCVCCPFFQLPVVARDLHIMDIP